MNPTQNPKPRILFVDDEPFAMSYYREDLETSGFEVVFLRSAKLALDRIGEPWDLVILDILMPPVPSAEQGQDGLRTGILLFRAFRNFHSQTPVVFLTNAEDAKVLGEIRDEPNVRIVPKTKVLPSELPAIIREFLREH